ncbi:hypothetical protein Ga0123462_1903 [Mariprofundus ferrinatatus]|uniref:Uncharacterized protein n=1 Tax=Mariprofundus ferrinatatus TaxID=1921087 RepID=A0A2K8L5Y6_9PROT|nr:hypothetical protein [Mariprofundus ferrinatatus]ATX82740.1 hypothetical protein Ga0123462_1903 [Mariprofundus ferrinatatus]
MNIHLLQMMIDDHKEMVGLIGRPVRYLDEQYEVTDLLHEEGLLIISADIACDVQEDSFGRARRLVPRRQNLKFRDAEGRPSAVWDDLAFLDGPLIP